LYDLKIIILGLSRVDTAIDGRIAVVDGDDPTQEAKIQALVEIGEPRDQARE
jgi:hypothetical protein